MLWDGKTCTFINMSRSEFNKHCVHYFDLDTDYGKIKTACGKRRISEKSGYARVRNTPLEAGPLGNDDIVHNIAEQ